LQLFQNLSGIAIDMKCRSDHIENGKKRDQIAGKKEGNKSRSDADTRRSGSHVQAPIWKKVGHHPPLQDEFKHKKSHSCGNQTSVKI